MFKIIITESIYNKIIADETAKTKHAKLLKILQHYDKQLISSERTQELVDHPENFYENPSSLYILDISQTLASGIQRNYGVMCMNGENLNASLLIDLDDYFHPKEGEKKFKGWDKVLDSVEQIPSNALIIKDRYLFKNRNPLYGEGIGNVSAILNELLPQKFEGEYHLTFVFDTEVLPRSFQFEKVVKKLNALVHQVRSRYAIMVEVLGITEDCELYNDTHDRQIVSNYYFVEATNRLAAFDPNDQGTVNQSITPRALFTNSSLDDIGSAPLETIEQTIEDFNHFYDALTNEAEHSTYQYALNGIIMKRCPGVRNRLLK